MADTTTKKGRGRPRKSTAEDKPVSNNQNMAEEELDSTQNESTFENDNSASDFNVSDTEEVNYEYTPLDDDVEYRGYEGGSNPVSEGGDSAIDIPQPILTFDNDIPNQKAEAASGKQSESTNESNSSSGDGLSDAFTRPKKESEERSYFTSEHSSSAETSTETPAEKRKNATKMADTLLLVYRDNVPTLFKYVAKFNEGKISRMELNGELDKAMPVLEDGTTVGQYIANVNAAVDNTFVITNDQLDEIRDPLIDWLMEKDLKLTPAQRLGIALGGQFISFGLAAFQQWQQNRHALNQFSEFHADWRGKKGGDIPHQQHTQQHEQPPRQEQSPQQEQHPEQDYHPVEEIIARQRTPMDNLSDLDNAEANNIMPNEDEAEYTVETVEADNTSDEPLDMDSYMNDTDSPSFNEDIPQ